MRFQITQERVRNLGIICCIGSLAILLALGRVPNSGLLNLAATGVTVHDDDHQQTVVKGIFALGDICSPSQLKHVANHEARVVQHNLLHPRRMIAADHRYIPFAVFSHPQVASVGLTEAAARQRHGDVTTFVYDLGGNGRSHGVRQLH